MLIIKKIKVIAVLILLTVFVACGGGNSDIANPNPVGTNPGGGSGSGGTSPNSTPLNLSLSEGAFWEFLGIAESTRFAQPNTNSAEVTVGRFRITLGAAIQISNSTAYPLNFSGDGGNFKPRWTHIAMSTDGSLLGSIDGFNLETIYDAQIEQWIGGGFFVEFDMNEQINLSEGVFSGNYNSLDALVAAHQQSTGGCELILGMAFCDDQSTSFSEREFYKAGIGPVGYSLDATFSSSGGGFTTAFTKNTRIELIETTFAATDGSVFNLPPWEEVAPLSTPRSGHSAVVLDGKIYVIGGAATDTVTKSVEIYDPDTNSWSAGVTMPDGLVAGSASVIDRKIYVPTSTTSLQVFDPDTSLWSEITPLNGAGLGMRDTAIYNDTNFGFGEIIVGAAGSPNIGFSGYALGVNGWLFASAEIFFVERLRETIEVVGDSMFLLGGFGRTGTVVDERGARNDITEYEIINDQWVTDFALTGRMNLARDGLATTVLNNTIYIFGGAPVGCSEFNPANCARGNPFRETEVYDPATRESTDLASMFSPRENFDAVVLAGKIYVIGGDEFGKVERFTP